MGFKRILSVSFVLIFCYSISCIEPVDIVKDLESGNLVVDGLITDEPGPYTITLTKSRPITKALENLAYVEGALVLMEDDAGNLDTLKEEQPGRYRTDPNGIRGVLGRKYRVQIKTKERHLYQSAYEEILPVGTIDSAYFRLKRRTVFNDTGGEEAQYNFDLFADATFPSAVGSFAIWRWTGTYEVLTYPKYKTRESREDPDFGGQTVTLPDPPKCSGFIFVRDLYLNNGLEYFAISSECSCCKCWVNQFSDRPVLSSNQFNATKFYDIALGSISAQDDEPFRYKYHVAVEMMSVTEGIYKYWENVATQKGNDIFIPPTGKLRGNIHSVENSPEAYGVFRASAVNRKSFYISSRSLPFGINSPPDSIREDCRKLQYSTNQKPSFWN
jgi:Domain of unknown function (DUF4249)